MVWSFLLFAQEAALEDTRPPWLQMVPLIAMVAVVLFWTMRSAKKQEQERKSLLSALKKNDKVVTAGGLIGTIVSMKENEDEVVLKVDENANVKIRMLRSSITRRLADEPIKDGKDGGAASS